MTEGAALFSRQPVTEKMLLSQVVELKLLKYYQMGNVTDITADWHRLAQSFEWILRNLPALNTLSRVFVTQSGLFHSWNLVIKTKQRLKHLTVFAGDTVPPPCKYFHCDLWCLVVWRGPIIKHCFLFSGWVIKTAAQKPLNRTLCHICAHLKP